MLIFGFLVLYSLLFAGLGTVAYLYLQKELERRAERLDQALKAFQSHMIRKRRASEAVIKRLQVQMDNTSSSDKPFTPSLDFKANMEARTAREAKQVQVNGIPVQNR